MARGNAMAKVTGLGGIFYKVADTAATQSWYEENLGVGGEWGAMFPFKNDDPDWEARRHERRITRSSAR